jgi:DNA invertase Pin-like site-specific DNA recombinase
VSTKAGQFRSVIAPPHSCLPAVDMPMATLPSVMEVFAEFQWALIHERQQEGIALANRHGVYRGRKQVLSPAQATQTTHRWRRSRPYGKPRRTGSDQACLRKA